MKKRPSNHLLLEMKRAGYSDERLAALCGTTRWSICNWLEEAEEQKARMEAFRKPIPNE